MYFTKKLFLMSGLGVYFKCTVSSGFNFTAWIGVLANTVAKLSLQKSQCSAFSVLLRCSQALQRI